jgi:uncharacterized protein YutE (UPF0331/DUF86 family)
MAELKERVEAEFENIERLLAEIPVNISSSLSLLELAGVAALLHNLYSGMENVLKQLVQAQGMEIPGGASWHRDLVEMTSSAGIISDTTAQEIRKYLAFRHFFSHAYVLDLQIDPIKPLADNAAQMFKAFRSDIEDSLAKGK